MYITAILVKNEIDENRMYSTANQTKRLTKRISSSTGLLEPAKNIVET